MTRNRNVRVCLYILSLLLNASLARGGAVKIAEINPGGAGSWPSNLTAVAETGYLSAYRFSTGRELWKLSGTNLTLAADINNTADDIGGGLMEGNDSVPDWLTPFQGQLFFSAFDPKRGGELWRYDGTNAIRVADINPDMNDSIKPMPNSSWPNELAVLGTNLFFSANSGPTRDNYELWRYNGASVNQVANIHADIGTNYSSYPKELTVFNNALYFRATDGANGYELWRSDGSSVTLLNIYPGGPDSSSFPKYFTAFNNKLYFQAFDSARGFELWSTDGSTVSLAADILPGVESASPEQLLVWNGALYFRATDSLRGYELWRFDGIEASLAADIHPTGDSFPKNLTPFGNLLLFAADDGLNGWELWSFDGRNATLVTNLHSAGDAFPESLTVIGNKMFFVATTPETGYEIFQYDGAAVTLAADINPGPGSSYPQSLAVYNNQLFFSAAEDGTSNWELWALSQEGGGEPNSPPSVAITSPQNGTAFAATNTITITADAADDRGVARVEFFANSSLIGTDTTAPYSISIVLEPGSYSLTAKATDSNEASTTSAAVLITVERGGGATNKPPVITLSSPQNGQTIAAPGIVRLQAEVSDSDGAVVQVQFFSNGTLAFTDSSPPFDAILTNLTAGIYDFTAVATDNGGQASTSAAIHVWVAEAPKIISITRAGQTTQLTVSGTAGIPLVVEASASLIPAAWAPIATNTPTTRQITFSDESAAAIRFYRVVAR